MPTEVLRHQLELEAQALAVLEERKKAFPPYWYEYASNKSPPTNKLFHSSRARIRILAGGNRSSKTESNVAEAIAHSLGYRPWILREMGLDLPDTPWKRPDNLPPDALCFDGLGVRVRVPNTGFLVTGQSLRKGIGETIWPKLQKYAAPFISGSHMSHAGVAADVIFKNGSRIVFGSAEQDILAFESTNYAWNAIDEPIPRRVYTGIARGSIDQFAPIWMTFTPLGPWAGWIFKDLYSPSLRTGADNRNLESFNLSIFENRFLPREAVEAFANDPAISDVEKEARLYGRFMHLTDRVYADFDERVHVIPPVYIPRDWFMGMAVDPHSIKPWAIAYFAVSPTGEVFIFKEWPLNDFTKIRRDPRSIEQYAQLIRQLDGDLPIQVRLMDPNYGPRKDMIRGVAVPSIASDIARYGLEFNYKLNDDLNYGESKVRALLHYNPAYPLDALNRPHLYITENCPNTIQALSLYTTKPKPGANIDGEIDDERRDETYKDFADVVRYIAVSQIGAAVAENLTLDMYESAGAGSSDLGLTGYGE